MRTVSDFTLEGLLSSLIAGQEIAVIGSKNTFHLANNTQKAALDFYDKNRKYWNSNVSDNEVNSLLSALSVDFDEGDVDQVHKQIITQQWRLTHIRAHRFGGLSVHCDAEGKAPPIFSENLDYPLVVVEGFNGAGKSSLLSAIIWCLTGFALRSQNIPQEISNPISAKIITDPPAEEEDDDTSLNIPPAIVPVPTQANLEILRDEPAVDTWVELTFVNEENNTCIVKRTLQKAGKNYKTQIEGIDNLELSDLALYVGTIMPSIATQMRFDQSEPLAKAVAELTGFAPLISFGSHCDRLIKNHLRGKHTKAAETTKNECVAQFLELVKTLENHCNHHSGLSYLTLPSAPLNGDDGAACKKSIEDATSYLEDLASQANGDFETILGRAPDLRDDKAVNQFVENELNNADNALKYENLSTLKSIQYTVSIGGLEEKDLSTSQSIIENILSEANELSVILEEYEKAKRYQLLINVAHWHEEHHEGSEFANCPVCSTDLDKVPQDAILKKSVKEALNECREAKVYLSKTAAKAEKDWADKLLTSLPEKVRQLVAVNLPNNMKVLYEAAFTVELFDSSSFAGNLAPLKANAISIWAELEENFPEPTPFELPQLPEVFPRSSNLSVYLERVANVIALAKYRSDYKEIILSILESFIGEREKSEGETEEQNKLPLKRQLELLRIASRNTHPISTANGIIGSMATQLNKWLEQNIRLGALERAANAVTPFTNFPVLVHDEVNGLRATLNSDIKDWVQILYSSQNRETHSFAGLGKNSKQLDLAANIGGVAVAAHEVLNASALRAYIWAFLLALWARVKEKQGGIGLFLLDDPQTLFDRRNAENMAAAVPKMVAAGISPIVTSNDLHFLWELRHNCSQIEGTSLQHGFFYLGPVTRNRPTAALAPQRMKLEKVLSEWSNDKDDLFKAQSFVQETRVYLETRLWDLLASDLDPTLLRAPCLGDLLARLQGLHNNGFGVFADTVFGNLVAHQDLAPGAEFYRIINEAHHSNSQNISLDEADYVAKKFGIIRKIIDNIWISHARYLGRLPSIMDEEDADILIPLPDATPVAIDPLPILGQLAAREDGAPLAVPDAETTDFEIDDLGDIAFFGVRTSALGIEVLKGQTVIASLEHEARNGDLVIAMNDNKILSRRLSTPTDIKSHVILETSRSTASKVAPTHALPKHSTRLLKIVGVLFDNHQNLEGPGEAKLVDESPALLDANRVAIVKDDSAYPVAKNGDKVLMQEIALNELSDENLNSFRDRIIAVEVSSPAGSEADHFTLLKRLGIPLPGQPRAFVLDNVGFSSSGEGEIIYFPSAPVNNERYLRVERLWKVVGVLYD